MNIFHEFYCHAVLDGGLIMWGSRHGTWGSHLDSFQVILSNIFVFRSSKGKIFFSQKVLKIGQVYKNITFYGEGGQTSN